MQNKGVERLQNPLTIIGLTGGTGSGKSVVSASLKKRNAYIIDCDRIAHEILLAGKPAYDEILEFFGSDVLDAEKQIIRRKLGDLVFSDSEKLAFLNRCTHKYIVLEIRKMLHQIQKTPDKYCCIVMDAPLLIEANLVPVCNQVWVVYAEESVRINRIMQRDQITYEQAKNRIQNQKSWEEYKSYADVILDNSKDAAHLEAQLDKLLSSIKKTGKRGI